VRNPAAREPYAAGQEIETHRASFGNECFARAVSLWG